MDYFWAHLQRVPDDLPVERAGDRKAVEVSPQHVVLHQLRRLDRGHRRPGAEHHDPRDASATKVFTVMFTIRIVHSLIVGLHGSSSVTYRLNS